MNGLSHEVRRAGATIAPPAPARHGARRNEDGATNEDAFQHRAKTVVVETAGRPPAKLSALLAKLRDIRDRLLAAPRPPPIVFWPVSRGGGVSGLADELHTADGGGQ